MNKFKYYFILLLAGISLVSCNKSDDDIEVEPLRDYQEQFNTDNANIEEYLTTNYITVTQSPGNSEDQDVVIDSITNPATQPSIMSYLNSTTFPKLLTKNVDLNGIAYKMYYLVLREGVGTSVGNTDGVLAAYKGEYLTRIAKTDKAPEYLETTFFEEVKFPQTSVDLYGAIVGWSETFPELKIGTSTPQPDGTIKYENFGSAVLFIPSGLGYYTGNGSIPAYCPLIFNVKFYNYKRLDHDFDGVLDYQEDINGDNYVRDFQNTTLYPNTPSNPDDTDKDGIPDFLDTDDDGDGYTTYNEITKPSGATYSGLSLYYPYDPIPDNPNTPNDNESEIWGIPRRPTGALADPNKPESITNSRAFVPADYTAPGRLRIHVDKTYPYQKN